MHAGQGGQGVGHGGRGQGGTQEGVDVVQYVQLVLFDGCGQYIM